MKIRDLYKIWITLATLCVASTLSTAAVIVVDDTFPTDGPLVGQVPSPGPGDAWAAHSGAGNVPVEVSGGQVVLTHGGGSREDVNSGFLPQTTGVVNYTFDVSVDDLGSPIFGDDMEYFASFGATGGTSTLLGRVDIVPPNGTIVGGSSDFTFGIATAGGAAEAVWPTDFAYGEVVNISVDYDIDMNQASLSVNGGTPIFGLSLGAGTTSIDDISLRQSTSSNNETIRIDNLTVTAPIPEPSALAILLIGLIGFVAKCRK